MHTVQQEEAAFRSVMAHRTMLKAYVSALIRDPVLAEDTFSEVTLEIVRSWARFDSSKPFPPWARGLARRVALATLRRQNRNPRLLDSATLEAIAEKIDTSGAESELDERKEALHLCLGKLSQKDQALIRQRYFENRSYEEMARVARRSVGALYIHFSRLHQTLFRCVARQSRLL